MAPRPRTALTNSFSDTVGNLRRAESAQIINKHNEATGQNLFCARYLPIGFLKIVLLLEPEKQNKGLFVQYSDT
jgi:hypothetical protein